MQALLPDILSLMRLRTDLLNAPAAACSTIPLIFQDKKFVDPATIITTDPTWSMVARPDVQSLGSLWYEHIYDPERIQAAKVKKFLPPPNPSCIPEFFGDTMLDQWPGISSARG